MNSEELEQSLRAEFESYLEDLREDMKKELLGFREKFDAEFRQHQERMDEAIRHLESEAMADWLRERGDVDVSVRHRDIAE